MPQLPPVRWRGPERDALEGGEEPETNNLLESAQTLLRRKFTLALIVLGGAIAAILISLAQNRMYEGAATLEIQSVNDNFLNLRDIDPTSTPNSVNESNFIQTQADILAQDALAMQVVRKLNLTDRPEFQPRPHRLDKVRTLLRIPASPRSPEQYALELAKKDLKITPSQVSRIIRITYDSGDPQLAADFSNALAQCFIEQSVEQRRRAAQQIQEWLSPQIEALRTKLHLAEAALDQYTHSTGLMMSPSQQNLAEEKLKSIQDELSKAQADRIGKQAEFNLTANNKPDVLLDDPSIRDYDTKIADLKRQQADMETIMTPENYKVVRLKAQIEQLEAARNQASQRAGSRISNDFKASTTREQRLQEAYTRQSGTVANLTNKMEHYNTLKHEVDTNRQFLEAMLQKINEAGVASAVRPSNIRQVGSAEPPSEPYKPNIPMNLAVGVFSSLILGVGFVLLQEQTQRQLRTPGDAGQFLNLPELGAIPKFQYLSPLPQRLLKGGANGDSQALERITWEQSLSGLSESFRASVASILSTGSNGDSPRVLVVTSSQPMEGKTTVASNLAIALSEISRRVLIIDGDARCPRLHNIFEQPNTWGLSDLLKEKNAADELPLEALVKKTAIPHLSLLPSGPCTDRIFSLLYSERMARLMHRFRREFDYVIVDAPPCLEFADARVLARYADGAVLVVRANHTSRKTALAAAQRLSLDGIPVVGTILNNWSPVSGAQSYGYYGYRSVSGDKRTKA